MLMESFRSEGHALQPLYRHELKYVLDNLQAAVLAARLPQIMQKDSHSGPEGRYEIRSLYFDDFRNSCYQDVENGTDPREKFRMRIYNHSDQRIRLELKRKEAGKTFKRSCALTRQQADLLIAGRNIPWDDGMDPLLKKFYIWFETRRARPAVIVEYDRVPFVHPDGNVRVTLDLNIRSSTRFDCFFQPRLPSRPIMPNGKQLLEVKYDQLIPDPIYRSIQTNQLQQTAYSKYYLCRKFGGFL